MEESALSPAQRLTISRRIPHSCARVINVWRRSCKWCFGQIFLKCFVSKAGAISANLSILLKVKYVATLAKPAFRLLFLYSFFVDLLKLNESSRSQS